MPANPLDDPELERSETALRAALFGVVAGGVFGKIRNPPRSPYFSGLLRRRDTGAVLGSRWWQDSWAWLHAKTDPLLTRIARDAGSAAVREFAAGLVEERALTAALATAEGQAAAMVAEIQATSAATLQELISDLGARDIATARLRDELAARLGPTPRQLRQDPALGGESPARRVEPPGDPDRRTLKGCGLLSDPRRYYRLRCPGRASQRREVSGLRRVWAAGLLGKRR